MENILTWINENIVWGPPALALFLSAGLFFSIKLRFAQLFKLPMIMKETLFTKKKTVDEKNLTPFQTLMSALATTLGTANIVAVGTAVIFGGAGAVFWMMLSAFFGMATCYAENVLGMKYREKKADGSYFGGAFFYIERAFKSSVAAKIFALLCILAGFGMGNMTQMNAMSTALEGALNIDTRISGAVGAIIIAAVVLGGIKRLGKASEKLIPVLSAVYILGCLAVIFVNIGDFGSCIARIFREAFEVKAGIAGFFGSTMILSMSWGVRRGIFSNEAGLGTSVLLHSASSEQNPEKQGMWAMLQVFFDTIVMCLLTALALLLSGADKLATDGGEAAIIAFHGVFGDFSGVFVAVLLSFFALTTTAGWYIYGARCLEYLVGKRFRRIFMLLYVVTAFLGATMKLETVWLLADLCNGTMALPNIVAMFIMSGEVTSGWRTRKQRKQRVSVE